MADKTGIEWTDATWNPLAGCSLVSPGCTNCYAMGVAHRLLDKPGSHYEGTTKVVNGNVVWTGKIAKAPPHIMDQPLRWKRPRMVFVNSMSDLFHEDVPDEWIDEVFAIMALCPQHTFQILTKRPERMRLYMSAAVTPRRIFQAAMKYKDAGPNNDQFLTMDRAGFPLGNVWLGVSVEDQRRAAERIPLLLDTPAAIRFLSMEPLVGGVNLNQIIRPAIKDPDKFPVVMETCLYTVKDRPAILPCHDTNKIDWVILGGESGKSARPMHPDWVRFTRDQCITAGVPFFFKQWGEWAPLEQHEGRTDGWVMHPRGTGHPPITGHPELSDGEAGIVRVGRKLAGNIIDNQTWQQMPERRM